MVLMRVLLLAALVALCLPWTGSAMVPSSTSLLRSVHSQRRQALLDTVSCLENLPRGGDVIRVRSQRDKTLNILGIVAAAFIVPSVALPAIRIAAVAVLALAVVNLATGHGLTITR